MRAHRGGERGLRWAEGLETFLVLGVSRAYLYQQVRSPTLSTYVAIEFVYSPLGK